MEYTYSGKGRNTITVISLLITCAADRVLQRSTMGFLLNAPRDEILRSINADTTRTNYLETHTVIEEREFF